MTAAHEAVDEQSDYAEQLAADRRDAARYRWLRRADSVAEDKRREELVKLYGDTFLDRAIDAAMRAPT